MRGRRYYSPAGSIGPFGAGVFAAVEHRSRKPCFDSFRFVSFVCLFVLGRGDMGGGVTTVRFIPKYSSTQQSLFQNTAASARLRREAAEGGIE